MENTMKIRFLLAFLLIIAVASTITVMANNSPWSDKPILYSEYDAGPLDRRVHFESWAWKDGSATFKVTPKLEDLHEDMLPSYGFIMVNEKEYKMSKRHDKEGRLCLFGSVPVDTFAMDRNIEYNLQAFDSNDVRLVNDKASNILAGG